MASRTVRFDIEFPNAREGVFVPAGFAGPEQIIDCAVLAERLGFHAVWATDFITPTPTYRIPEGEVASWYEPLTTLAFAAARTTTLRLGTGLILAPYRDPVILAKQAATLDRLSGGRLLLGLGIGMARDEFTRVRPRERRRNRGRVLDELIELVLRLLGPEEEVSHDGEHFAVDGIALNPKPIQDPLPIYVPVRKAAMLDRVRRHAVNMTCPNHSLPELLAQLRREAPEHAERVDAVAEGEIVLGEDVDDAMRRYARTRHGSFRLSKQPRDAFIEANWVGTEAEVIDRLSALRERGVDHFVALHVAADSLAERHEHMHRVAERILPALSG